MTDDRLPPLARSAVDRAALRRSDPQWLAVAWQRARVLVISPTGRALCTFAEEGAPVQPREVSGAPSSGPRLVFLAPSAAPDGERLFLGVDRDGTPYFAVVAELPEPPELAELAETRAVTLREVGALLPDLDAGLFTTAAALVNWHAAHPYSPTTGEATTVAEGGWLRVDGSGKQIFPRTDPAIIVLVHDGVAGPGGRCLLGQNAGWRVRRDGRRFFSTLAGFVEPGESAEAAVAREVHEEVGVTVSQLRYQGSQGWPFPGSLMLGFTGRADPEQPLRPDLAEIAEARWFTRSEIGTLLSDQPDPRGALHGAATPEASVNLPGPASIAHYLIRTWLSG